MRSFRKIGSLLTAVTVFLVLCGSAFWAGAENASGSCGDHLTWELTGEGTLTISGTGAMTDGEYGGCFEDDERVKKVIVKEGVTSIGDRAFSAARILRRSLCRRA